MSFRSAHGVTAHHRMIVTIDDRFLLLALDRLYREAMQPFERTALLPAARKVADALDVGPSKEPVEGYYATDPALSEYFRLMRALQDVSQSRDLAVARLREFRLLWDVSNSPIYGRPERGGQLLPKGIDALGQALLEARPEWTVARLLPAARRAAVETDDYSLVGLAARVGDAVVLTALRESVVLYAHLMLLGVPSQPTFEWRVDPELAAMANRFVQAFNAFVPNALPAVVPENAGLFYDPDRPFADVAGRCVRIGVDPDSSPARHYHWAIWQTSNGELNVQEFWSTEIWTTRRYLAERTRDGRCVHP